MASQSLSKTFARKNRMMTTPWSNCPTPNLEHLETFLAHDERRLCYWLGHSFDGIGNIVDAGSFLGGSAYSIAEGLKDNSILEENDKTGRIFCYDVFKYAEYMANTFKEGNSFQRGESILGRFHDNLSNYIDYVTVIPGLIENRCWRYGAIHTIFIDCAKSFPANSGIMRRFLPSLKPGGLLIQQDYAFPSRLIWIHASMEYFHNKFELIGYTSRGGSTVFKLQESISSEEVESCIDEIKTRCVELCVRASERWHGEEKMHHAILASIESFKANPLEITAT
jgi:predicted O-methyltransferase YrrM